MLVLPLRLQFGLPQHLALLPRGRQYLLFLVRQPQMLLLPGWEAALWQLAVAVWRLVMPYFSRLRKKALPRFAAVDQIFREMTESQQRLEKSGCSSTDQAAEPTAKALSALLAMLQDDPLERRVLEQMGYQLGRWIYFMDALDDIHEDFINKGYNPFIQKNPELFEGITEEQWKKEGIPETILDSAIGSLNLTAAQLAAAYGLLTVRQLKPVLDNIIYLGLEESRKAVLLRHRPAEKRPKAENFTNSDG